MIFPGFVGPSYQARSLNFDAQRSLNLYPEVSGSGTSKTVSVLMGTPGLLLFITLIAGAVRGLFAGGSRMFAVAGADLYEIFADQTYVDRSIAFGHPLVNDGNPAIILPNGNQLGISSGGVFYCDNGAGPIPPVFPTVSGVVNTSGTSVVWVSGDTFDTSGLWSGQIINIGASSYFVASVIDEHHLLLMTSAGVSGPLAYSIDPIVKAGSLAFLDGYFIVAIPNSKRFYISGINDGTSWDPLDFASKEAYPDYISRVFAHNEQLWIFGKEQSTEVWQNTGGSFPFQRIPGAVINFGCAAPYSVAKLANGLAWLATDTLRGGVTCVFAQGFSPSVISTPAVENAWNSYATVDDAVAYSYTENKHQFLVISFPTGNATWVFDATTNLWHERGWWSGSANIRQRQSFHAYSDLAAHGLAAAIPARHFVGDWQNGKIYIQDMSYMTDDGTQIQRIRTCPHLSNEQKWLFYSQFYLDMQVPSGGPTTINPILDWSDDGGYNFGTAHTYPGGATSAAGRATRVIWRRLGKSRDRIFRVKITDAVPIALLGAYLEFEVGNF